MNERMTNKLYVKENLEFLMMVNNTNPTQLAEDSGVPQPTIHRIISGESKDPKTTTLERLASFFGYTATDLREKNLAGGDLTDPNLPREAMPIKQRIPLISTVQAGPWTEGVELPYADVEYYPYHKKTSKRAFALRVVGTSMQPDYQPGDIIIINPDKQYKHGSDVVVLQDDGVEVTFKRLSIEEGGKLYLKPVNRDFVPRMMPLTGKILGVCIGQFTERDD